MKHISSRDNQKIKHALKLINNSKFRNKENMFFIEGRKLIREAFEFKDLLVRIFINEDFVEDYQEELNFGGNDIEINLLNSKLMRILTDTENPQGIAAVVKKPIYELNSLVKNKDLFVLLDHISDPGNMGTIIRTAWAFEVGGILLTQGCVDPFSPKVIRSTMGGIFNVPVVESVTIEDINFLKDNCYNIIGTSLETKKNHYSVSLTGKSIIVIGNEARGMSDEFRNICNEFIKIPMNYKVDSLNAAVACAIIIAEAWKQKKGCSLY